MPSHPRSWRPQVRALALALSAGLAVAACGTSGGDPGAVPPATTSSATPSSATSSTAAPSATASSVPGSPVPPKLAFTAATVGGGSFDGRTLAGRNTVLWFWAPWCTVCARSAAGVREAAAMTPGVTFVGVAGLSSDSDAMKAFVQRHGVADLTHLADTGGDLYTRFAVRQQHTFVLVGADGKVSSHPAYGHDIDVADLVRSTFG